MRCAEAAELLTALVDGELPDAAGADVEAHIAGCAACAAAVEEERALVARLRASPRPPLPAGFEAAVMARVREAAPARAPSADGATPGPRGRIVLWPFVVGGAGLAAGILLVVAAGGDRSAPGHLAAEVPAARERAPASAVTTAAAGVEAAAPAEDSLADRDGAGAGSAPPSRREVKRDAPPGYRGPAGEVAADSRPPEEPPPSHPPGAKDRAGGAAPPAGARGNDGGEPVGGHGGASAEPRRQGAADGGGAPAPTGVDGPRPPDDVSARLDDAAAGRGPTAGDGGDSVRKEAGRRGPSSAAEREAITLAPARRFAVRDAGDLPHVALFYAVPDPEGAVRVVNEALLADARLIHERVWLDRAPAPGFAAGEAGTSGERRLDDAGTPPRGGGAAAATPEGVGEADARARGQGRGGGARDGLLSLAAHRSAHDERVLLLSTDVASIARVRASLGALPGFREVGSLLSPAATAALAAEGPGVATSPRVEEGVPATASGGSASGPPLPPGGSRAGAGVPTPPPPLSPEVLERLAGGIPPPPPTPADASSLRERFGEGRGVRALVEVHLVAPAPGATADAPPGAPAPAPPPGGK